MDRGAWWATTHGVVKSWTQLSMNTHTLLLKTVNIKNITSVGLFSTSVTTFLLCRLVHLNRFSRFHIQAILYNICFSPDFTYSYPGSKAVGWIGRWGLAYTQSSAGLIAMLCLTLATPWTSAHQAPLSMGFFRQNSRQVRCHFLLQGNLPDPGIEVTSPALQVGSFTTEPQGSHTYTTMYKMDN